MNCLGHKVIFGSTEDGMKAFEIKKMIGLFVIYFMFCN